MKNIQLQCSLSSSEHNEVNSESNNRQIDNYGEGDNVSIEKTSDDSKNICLQSENENDSESIMVSPKEI